MGLCPCDSRVYLDLVRDPVALVSGRFGAPRLPTTSEAQAEPAEASAHKRDGITHQIQIDAAIAGAQPLYIRGN